MTLQANMFVILTLNDLCYSLCPLRGKTVENGPSQGSAYLLGLLHINIDIDSARYFELL